MIPVIRHIACLFGLLLGVNVLHLQAQSSHVTQSYYSTDLRDNPTSVEDKVLSKIESLKRLVAGLNDEELSGMLDSIGYLAIVQSAISNTSGASNPQGGWWGLTYPVAIKYELVINDIVDERNNLQKATKAVNEYLSDLRKHYNQIELADLAFIESPVSIAKYLHDSINHPLQYKQITSTNNDLLKIKKLYIENRNKYPVGPIESNVQVDSKHPISFEALHQYLKIPTHVVCKLNPQWINNVFDPSYGKLLLPVSYAEEFEKNKTAMEQKTRGDQITLTASNSKRINQLKGDIPDLKTHKPVSYKVKMGDNLGRIAQNYHVKISRIRAWNNLRSDRIYAGQRLTLYIPVNQKVSAVRTKTKKQTQNKLTPGAYLNYTVKKGDTLWSISQKHEHVSIENIMDDNGVDEKLTPGQILKIRNE